MILEDWLWTTLQFLATPTKNSIKYLKKKRINITLQGFEFSFKYMYLIVH